MSLCRDVCPCVWMCMDVYVPQCNLLKQCVAATCTLISEAVLKIPKKAGVSLYRDVCPCIGMYMYPPTDCNAFSGLIHYSWTKARRVVCILLIAMCVDPFTLVDLMLTGVQSTGFLGFAFLVHHDRLSGLCPQ